MKSKKVSYIIRKVVSLFPKGIRHKLIRNAASVPQALQNTYTFKVAETTEELEAAYRILYDSYLREGYETSNSNQLRIVKYAAVPQTVNLIAKFKNEVIATMMIIQDSSIGLPLKNIYHIDETKTASLHVAEISGLAIHPDYRLEKGKLLFPFCKFLWKIATEYLNLDRIYIVVHPKTSDFYEAILFFDRLKKKPIANYSFVNGAKGVVLCGDPQTILSRLNKTYRDCSQRKNFYKYFIFDQLENFILPEKSRWNPMAPTMNPQMLRYFFYEKSDTFLNLSLKELVFFHNLYPIPSYQRLFPSIEPFNFPKRTPRFPSSLRGFISKTTNQIIIRAKEVSSDGLRISANVHLDKFVEVTIFLPNGLRSKMSCELIWKNKDFTEYGLKITHTNPLWTTFIQGLQSDYEEKCRSIAA